MGLTWGSSIAAEFNDGVGMDRVPSHARLTEGQCGGNQPMQLHCPAKLHARLLRTLGRTLRSARADATPNCGTPSRRLAGAAPARGSRPCSARRRRARRGTAPGGWRRHWFAGCTLFRTARCVHPTTTALSYTTCLLPSAADAMGSRSRHSWQSETQHTHMWPHRRQEGRAGSPVLSTSTRCL